MKVKRRKSAADVPSMAMGDIAFNLLIFFVILARAQDDSHLQWQPAATPEVESAGQSRASIVVDVENKLYLNGAETSEGQLSGGLKELLDDANTAEQRIVLLKIHKDATASRFEPIIEAVSEAGGTLVHVLEEENP